MNALEFEENLSNVKKELAIEHAILMEEVDICKKEHGVLQNNLECVDCPDFKGCNLWLSSLSVTLAWKYYNNENLMDKQRMFVAMDLKPGQIIEGCRLPWDEERCTGRTSCIHLDTCLRYIARNETPFSIEFVDNYHYGEDYRNGKECRYYLPKESVS